MEPIINKTLLVAKACKDEYRTLDQIAKMTGLSKVDVSRTINNLKKYPSYDVEQLPADENPRFNKYLVAAKVVAKKPKAPRRFNCNYNPNFNQRRYA